MTRQHRFLLTMLLLLAWLLPGAPQAQARQIYCPMVHDPVCALEAVYCLSAPCPPQRRTFSNACLARLAGARILYKGPCRTIIRPGRPPIVVIPGRPPRRDIRPRRSIGPGWVHRRCKVWRQGCTICRRTRPGAKARCKTSRACLRREQRQRRCITGRGNGRVFPGVCLQPYTPPRCLRYFRRRG